MPWMGLNKYDQGYFFLDGSKSNKKVWDHPFADSLIAARCVVFNRIRGDWTQSGCLAKENYLCEWI